MRLTETLSRDLPPKQLPRIRIPSRKDTGYASGEKATIGIGRIGLGALSMALPSATHLEGDRVALDPKDLPGIKIDGPNHLLLPLPGVNHNLPCGNYG